MQLRKLTPGEALQIKTMRQRKKTDISNGYTFIREPFDEALEISGTFSGVVNATINKNAYAQINYGTGKDVSDEDISDAIVPLKIQWHNDSYVEIPLFR